MAARGGALSWRSADVSAELAVLTSALRPPCRDGGRKRQGRHGRQWDEEDEHVATVEGLIRAHWCGCAG